MRKQKKDEKMLMDWLLLLLLLEEKLVGLEAPTHCPQEKKKYYPTKTINCR